MPVDIRITKAPAFVPQAIIVDLNDQLFVQYGRDNRQSRARRQQQSRLARCDVAAADEQTRFVF